jgi:mRNA interferase HicA
MNRRQFEQYLREHGCILHHHGGKHDVWVNPVNLAQAPVPRHQVLKRGTVRGICRILGIPRPTGI